MKGLLALIQVVIALAFIGAGLYIVVLGGICVGYAPGLGIMFLLVGGVVTGIGVMILGSMLK